MDQVLSGIRVLDCTQAMAGPFATLQLENLGADVIKVEPPGGDSTRRWGPFVNGLSMPFLAVNRGKRSVSLNLKDEAEKQQFLALADTADVLVENHRPGVMARLGLDFETLASRNSRLVYCSISGFGQTGPYAARGGYDLIAQGMSGIMSVTGEHGRPPVKAGVPVTDLGAALFAAQGVLAALLWRDRSGKGQHIDVSLFDAGVSLSVWEAHEYFATKQAPQPMGSAHRLLAPYQALRAGDGHFTVGAGPQRLWERLCNCLDRTDLIERSAYATEETRRQHQEELERELEAITSTQPRAHWLARLEAAGVPCGPIYDYDELFSDPHTKARELQVEIELDDSTTTATLGVPYKLSATPLTVRGGLPELSGPSERPSWPQPPKAHRKSS